MRLETESAYTKRETIDALDDNKLSLSAMSVIKAMRHELYTLLIYRSLLLIGDV